MLSNNHNSCRFAEQIVAYIYDEATATEKENFEAHLPNCLSCADEIAGFGLVRSSITDWRKTEIYEPQTVEKSSWLEGFRKLLTFNPAWAGGFAAMLVCVGLIWVFSGDSKPPIAANTAQEIPPVISNQDKEKTPQPQEEKVSVNPKEEDSKIAPKPVKAVEKKIVQPTQNPVRASKTVPKPKSVTPKTDNFYAGNKSQKQKAPTLSEVDGDEDNSLRLAELFDEIDSK
jgi:hypothetical protein